MIAKRAYYILLGIAIAATILTKTFSSDRWFAVAATALVVVAFYPLGKKRASLARISLLGRPREPGHCPKCGYDLRVQLALSEQSESNGHSESNGRAIPARCPECGMILTEVK